MQHLYEGLGTMNVAQFPRCITGLLEVHRAQCHRRAQGWTRRRVVLLMPADPLLEKYTLSVDMASVDVHFDHVIYFDQADVEALLRRRASEPYQPELYDSECKKDTQIAAPRGQFVQLPESCRALALQSISLWLSANEVYWLSR